MLVEGSVRYDQQRVHVTAQLVDAGTNARLWEQAFDRPLTVEHIFDIQTEIADRVTEGLARSLSASEGRHTTALPTASLSAYEAFLLGKYHYRRRQPGDSRREDHDKPDGISPTRGTGWRLPGSTQA